MSDNMNNQHNTFSHYDDPENYDDPEMRRKILLWSRRNDQDPDAQGGGAAGARAAATFAAAAAESAPALAAAAEARRRAVVAQDDAAYWELMNVGVPSSACEASVGSAADAHGAGAADAADAHGIPQSYPSICIPRTWSNVTWSLVKDAFEEIFGDGSIERVDVVPRQAPNGEYFNKIFIHFVKWPETEYAQNIRQSLLDGKTIKLVYQFPWYWKCVLSNLPKRRWKGPAPYMEVLEDSHTQTKTELNLVEEGFAPSVM